MLKSHVEYILLPWSSKTNMEHFSRQNYTQPQTIMDGEN